MSSNIQRSENNMDICKFEYCDRIANYRRLKVGNCHLKNTMSIVEYIVQNGQLTNDSHIKQFLINMK